MKAERRAITLQRLAEADYPLLAAWLAEPHVREWWGDPDEEITLIREGEASGESEGWIVYDRDRPVAYVQSWTPSDYEEEWQVAAPRNAVGIDIFVGPADCVGRGVGSRVLRAFARHLLATGAARVLIDPDAAKPRAIRAYEKAGFRRFALAGRDGDTVLMEFAPEAAEEPR